MTNGACPNIWHHRYGGPTDVPNRCPQCGEDWKHDSTHKHITEAESDEDS